MSKYKPYKKANVYIEKMINEYFSEWELYIPKTVQVKYSLDIKIDYRVYHGGRNIYLSFI